MHLREKISSDEENPLVVVSPVPGSQRLPTNRHQGDRRQSPTRFRDTLRPPLQRAEARRQGEIDRLYVDRYRGSDVALLLIIFAINIADAFFTLHWVNRGGSEGNPLMDWLLSQGHMSFVFFKCLVVGGWLLVLTVHKNFRLARWGLRVLLIVYAALLVYHIFLYALAEPIPRIF